MTTGEPERRARMAWSWLAEPADEEAARFVEEHGYVHALELVRAGDARAGRSWAARLPGLDLAALERVHDRLGVRVLVPGDPEWPERLDELSGAPHCLYARGEGDLAAIAARSVALVGARAASDYGVRVASEIAQGVAHTGMAVVSGGAFGIDAAAHRGALAVGAPTVAVLACGLDRLYPSTHQPLFSRIADDGVLVSEQPVGYAPLRIRFLSRNRLISGMTRGTVVIEAGRRSGALNTATHAEQQRRPLGAVPGPVTSPTSAGCHQLIRDQRAVLVTDAREVLDLCGRLGEDALLPVQMPESSSVDLLPLEVRVVYDAIPPRAGVGFDHLVRVTGQLPMTLTRNLAILEIDQHIRRRGTDFVRVRQRGVAGCVPPAVG